MSGELQTIPARHGVATFVPRGRTIKVINTYGKQVVSMWAFTLGAPPEDEDMKGEAKEMDKEEAEKKGEDLKNNVGDGGSKHTKAPGKDEEQEPQQEDGSDGKETQSTDEKADDAKQQDGGNEEPQSAEKESDEAEEENGDKKESQSTEKEAADSKEEEGKKESQSTEKEADDSKEDAAEDPPEQAPDTPQDDKTKEDTASSSKQPNKRTWASYLPSLPYRSKGTTSKSEAEQKPNEEQEKKQNEENTKKWSSYLPTGKSFSSYVPSVEVPDSKSVVSAFKSSHNRDPNKSYAEQLYDFSKTPVGAGTIAAATGSGYASSVYAAYNAYAMSHPSNSSQPPMEYLSLPHTRAASHKLGPEVDDELLTNLRNPIITMIEDTSPGAHDTLTAACDANLYAALGVDKPAEHGSCAENLVLALKEINETAGLKGAKAVGADISVNIAPTPLHLFMNAPLKAEGIKQSDGAGTKAVTIQVDEPQGKKRCFVRFRAERDVVIVFSACPMDVGKQNGGRCMAANFMVENAQEGEDLASSVSAGKAKKQPKKLNQKGKPEEKKEDAVEQGTAEKDNAGEEDVPENNDTEGEQQTPTKDDEEKEGAPEKEQAKGDQVEGEQTEEEQPKEEQAERDQAEGEQKVPEKEQAEGGQEAPQKGEEEKKPAQEAPEEEAKKEESSEKKEDSAAEEPKPKKKPKKLQVRSKAS